MTFKSMWLCLHMFTTLLVTLQNVFWLCSGTLDNEACAAQDSQFVCASLVQGGLQLLTKGVVQEYVIDDSNHVNDEESSKTNHIQVALSWTDKQLVDEKTMTTPPAKGSATHAGVAAKQVELASQSWERNSKSRIHKLNLLGQDQSLDFNQTRSLSSSTSAALAYHANATDNLSSMQVSIHHETTRLSDTTSAMLLQEQTRNETISLGQDHTLDFDQTRSLSPSTAIALAHRVNASDNLPSMRASIHHEATNLSGATSTMLPQEQTGNATISLGHDQTLDFRQTRSLSPSPGIDLAHLVNATDNSSSVHASIHHAVADLSVATSTMLPQEQEGNVTISRRQGSSKVHVHPLKLLLPSIGYVTKLMTQQASVNMGLIAWLTFILTIIALCFLCMTCVHRKQQEQEEEEALFHYGGSPPPPVSARTAHTLASAPSVAASTASHQNLFSVRVASVAHRSPVPPLNLHGVSSNDKLRTPALCKELLVPEGSECELKVPIFHLSNLGSRSEFPVTDARGHAAFRITILLPSSASSQDLSSQESMRMILSSAEGDCVLAYSSIEQANDPANSAVTLHHVSSAVFGAVKYVPGRGFQFTKSLTWRQWYIMFHQKDERGMRTVVDERQDVLASQMKGEDASYQIITIGSFVDAGFVLLAVLGIDMLECQRG